MTRLPVGQTTVPFIEYGTSLHETQEQLGKAGLRARSPDVDFPFYVTGTNPTAGAVVEVGREIELSMGDG